LQQEGNEGIFKFWFDREIISLSALSAKFMLQKAGWLHERYIPELHGQGRIHGEYQKICLDAAYRNEAVHTLEKPLRILSTCIELIPKFIALNAENPAINEQLDRLQDNLKGFRQCLDNCSLALARGEDYHHVDELQEVDAWSVANELKKISPDNLQKNILPKIISLAEEIHRENLPLLVNYFRLLFKQAGRLIIGDAGTGKTHGLANCVETHLQSHCPAVMVRAKGASAQNWTTIMLEALELSGWQKEEMFSALEALATRVDVHRRVTEDPGEDPTYESAKVLICVDGLEEDNERFEEWYARIRESVELAKIYPRVRFIFSARRNFYDNTQAPEDGVFETIFLPREGDVPVLDVAPKYFSKERYNIEIPSYELIRGIDSLLALRLFCEHYQNSTLSGADQLVTATRELINLKVEKINSEFVSSLERRIGTTRSSVRDALGSIAGYFYSYPEIEHSRLVELIAPGLLNYLNASEVDLLIDFLTQNGFLVRFEETEQVGILNNTKHLYTITYQSLIEHIISEQIYKEIRDGSQSRIPEFLHRPMAAPLSDPVAVLSVAPNERIIQNIVNNLLVDTGKLIGENEFLTEGFDEKEILKMQLTALSQAPPEIAARYKSFVNSLLTSDYMNYSTVIEFLILPSTYVQGSTFGADFLHEWLSAMPSVFERDKIWSGLDRHELGKLSKVEKIRYQHGIYALLFNGGLGGVPELSQWDLHNGRPLVLACGLSTIDQELRHKLRVALTEWAIQNSSEFALLLEKYFPATIHKYTKTWPPLP